MKRICIVTATRAEYGLLKPIIKKLREYDDADVKVAVTGAHLSPEFGLTYLEIEKDGIEIDKKIEILLSADTPSAISKSMGLAISGFADYFSESNFDLLVVLGDRYETLAVCIAAINQNIPIAHMHGGETTEGAVDEAMRHSITKMSYLHFTSTQEYKNRVIQLGENPERVFNFGAIGVENIKKCDLMSKDELEKSLGLSLNRPYVVITFHPVTLEGNTSEQQINDLMKVVADYDDMSFIFTKANSDRDGRIINNIIDDFAKEHSNCIAVASLGLKRYLSAVKYCSIVVGNSSSGILEAPSFNVPTINIGDRQKGRIQAQSVINCKAEYALISDAFKKALDSEFVNSIKNVHNPYEMDGTSDNISNTIMEFLREDKIDIKKKFYDVDPSIK